MHYLRLAIVALAMLPMARGQAGHWEGQFHSTVHASDIVLDLAKNDKGEWMGTIAFPEQHTKVPLANITVKDAKVRFTVTRLPGKQSFDGAVFIDGKSISGMYTFNGQKMPCRVERAGEAKFDAPVKNPPLAGNLEGTWEGTLTTNGRKQRMKLTLGNGPDGATGTVVSVDQGGADIPVTAIAQKDSNITLQMAMISAVFTGEVSGDGTQIAGQWKQSSLSLPITFKRQAK